MVNNGQMIGSKVKAVMGTAQSTLIKQPCCGARARLANHGSRPPSKARARANHVSKFCRTVKNGGRRLPQPLQV